MEPVSICWIEFHYSSSEIRISYFARYEMIILVIFSYALKSFFELRHWTHLIWVLYSQATRFVIVLFFRLPHILQLKQKLKPTRLNFILNKNIRDKAALNDHMKTKN